MAVLRYLVPALGAAGYAAAASCSVSATTTIQNSGDATALASCQTFTGSIAIATGTTGNIALDGIQVITGDLVANNVTQMQSLSSASLIQIGGQFLLASLTVLSQLDFPLLTRADTVSWTALPQLQGLMMQSGLQQVSSLTISDTNIASLKGINLQKADVIEIDNNNFLTEITMQLGNVSTNLDIHSNGANLAVSFPNLVSVKDMTIKNAGSISIPSLAAVNDSLGFYSNSLQTLNAPNLTSVAGTLAVDLNNALTNASFPELTTVGGALQLQNNTVWDKLNGFPNLQFVGGAVEVYGNFSEFDLPKINTVRGDFNVQSSSNIDSSCSVFQPLMQSGGAIRGHYTCHSNSPTPTNNGSDTSTGTDSGSAASAKPSKGVASSMLIPGATTLLGVVAAVFGLL